MIKNVDDAVVCKENCKVWRINAEGKADKRLLDDMAIHECQVTQNELLLVEFKGKFDWQIKEAGDKIEYKCNFCEKGS